tara:strand:- start:525 stop:992 length:468 start_codon:yes stop_codon:yes gene_type:complete
MIQITRDNSTTQTTNNIYLDLYSQNPSNLAFPWAYTPMIEITSIMSKNSKVFRAASVTTTDYKRYILLRYKVTNDGSETLLSGIVSLGNDDFPYGFYDIEIYGSSDNTSLTPSPSLLLYKGMANFEDSGTNPGISYKAYVKNDTDTESIYITNTI